MSWTTQDLQAYLVGQASAADAAAIEADLLADPALEDRLMALDPLAAQLEGASAAITGPTAAQTAQWTAATVVKTANHGFDWRHIAASAVLGAVITSGIWLANSATSTPDWRAEVATYQALYSPETIAAISLDEGVLSQQIDDVGARVGFKDLRQLTDNMQDLELLRGQILAHEGQPLAQIVFSSADGLPIALCLIARDDADADGAITMANRAGLASASFETENHSWLLIGTQDDALIARTAEQVVAQLAAL